MTLAVTETCLNGWATPAERPECSYTGGCYCNRRPNHNGRCRCVCGTTHAAPSPGHTDSTTSGS